MKLKMPPSSTPLPPDLSEHLAASFSTAFSENGHKFAVASQEGVVAVWDVRSSNPLKVFDIDKDRSYDASARGGSTATSSEWIDESWSFAAGAGHGGGPGWCARNVKFAPGGSSEVMTFTEVSIFMRPVSLINLNSSPSSAHVDRSYSGCSHV
jgi:WD40 repeat protein